MADSPDICIQLEIASFCSVIICFKLLCVGTYIRQPRYMRIMRNSLVFCVFCFLLYCVGPMVDSEWGILDIRL